nr:alpha-N-arabinofuranosidase [Prevotella sp.]
MIEWANGDPATSKWARMRADAGHPAPFNLKYIGIGNEDIISTDFEERCLMICKAIRERYPEIQICGTAGPFHDPSSDYIEGWKFAKEHKDLFNLIDEHYYESTGWFLNNQHYYDQYDRKGPKVYLGEWASRSRTVESAIVEAMHFCSIERNGDVVEMTSYAPLLCNDKHHNWDPDMIYFTNNSLTLTPSYHTQRLFGTYAGDRYVPSALDATPEVSHRFASSIVSDSKTCQQYLRLVNALPLPVRLTVEDITLPDAPKFEGFTGTPESLTTTPITDLQVVGNEVLLPAYSVVIISL